MADKYLKSGGTGADFEQVEFLIESAGAADAGKAIALNNAGQVDGTMLPTDNAIAMVASEDISAGNMINIFNGAGAPKVRKADKATGKRAHGFAPGAIAEDASGEVVLREGLLSGLSSLTVGAQYFLGNAGAITATPTTTEDEILQPVGVAKSATELSFVAGPVTVVA